MCSRGPPERSHATSPRMDSEGQGCTAAANDQTRRRQHANVGILAHQFSGLKVGFPLPKDTKRSRGGAPNQCLKQTSNMVKSFDRDSNKTSSLQTSNVTLASVDTSVTCKPKDDEKDTSTTTLDISASKSGSSTCAEGYSETVILELSVPSHSNIKQNNGTICAGSSTHLDKVPPVANGFNNEKTFIDMPISLDEKLEKLSLNSPEILLERGPVSKPRVSRTANDDKPYSRPDSTRPQSTASSSDASINHNVDDYDADAFIRSLIAGTTNSNEQAPDLVPQGLIPKIVFDKMNEEETEKKIPKSKKKKGQVSTKAAVPSSTEHLDKSLIRNPQSFTNHREGQSSASAFRGPGLHPEVSVCPMALSNQATLSQVGNRPPIFPPASQVLYQQQWIPPVSGSDTCLLTPSPCGQQRVFSADPFGHQEQQQETFQGMNTSPVVGMDPVTTSVIPDQYGYVRYPEQLQFNSCNPNKAMTIPELSMRGLGVGNHMNVARGVVNGQGWQISSCGGQQINYCLSERNMSEDGGQAVPVQPTTAYLAYVTENSSSSQQQPYGVDVCNTIRRGQQHVSAPEIGGTMANGGQHVPAHQFGGTIINGGQHVPTHQFGGSTANGGQHLPIHQIGGTMTNGVQQVSTHQIGGTTTNGGPHLSTHQTGGTMVNGGQNMPAGQMGGTMVNGGQHMAAGLTGGIMVIGNLQMPTDYTVDATMSNCQHMPDQIGGGTMVNGGQRMPAGLMMDAMMNGAQHMPAGQMGGTMMNGGQKMPARETGRSHVIGSQIDCVMANAGHQICNQRMRTSMSANRVSSPLALLITLGQQIQNVPIQNGRRRRKLLPKQKQ